jgi:hypothetical protein
MEDRSFHQVSQFLPQIKVIIRYMKYYFTLQLLHCTKNLICSNFMDDICHGDTSEFIYPSNCIASCTGTQNMSAVQMSLINLFCNPTTL